MTDDTDRAAKWAKLERLRSRREKIRRRMQASSATRRASWREVWANYNARVQQLEKELRVHDDLTDAELQADYEVIKAVLARIITDPTEESQ